MPSASVSHSSSDCGSRTPISFSCGQIGNSRIRSENVGREADIRIFPRNIAHDAKRLLALCLGFAGIAQNDVEDDMNSRQVRFAGGLHHLFHVLKALVHQPEHFLGGGLGAESDVVHATFGKQAHIVVAHQRQKICGGLEVPPELECRCR